MADADDKDVTVDPIKEDPKEDKQDSPKAEPSPAKDDKPKEAKSEKPEVAEGKKEEKAETPTPPDLPSKEEGKEEPEAKAEEEAPAEEPEDKPQGKAEERKVQLNSEIRDLVSRKNALQAEVEKANAEVYQPATEDELTEQGMNALEAKVEAMRQQNEMEKYNSKVAEAQLTISSESERVLADFPQFNSESDKFDKELAEEAAELLEANLIYDPNSKQVIGSNVSPYQLYKTLARASDASATKGQLKAQQANEQMLANADGASSAAPQSKEKDPVLEILKSDD